MRSQNSLKNPYSTYGFLQKFIQWSMKVGSELHKIWRVANELKNVLFLINCKIFQFDLCNMQNILSNWLFAELIIRPIAQLIASTVFSSAPLWCDAYSITSICNSFWVHPLLSVFAVADLPEKLPAYIMPWQFKSVNNKY